MNQAAWSMIPLSFEYLSYHVPAAVAHDDVRAQPHVNHSFAPSG